MRGRERALKERLQAPFLGVRVYSVFVRLLELKKGINPCFSSEKTLSFKAERGLAYHDKENSRLGTNQGGHSVL